MRYARAVIVSLTSCWRRCLCEMRVAPTDEGWASLSSFFFVLRWPEFTCVPRASNDGVVRQLGALPRVIERGKSLAGAGVKLGSNPLREERTR